jgi:lauroyl/myristoyl acyltransferase
VSRDLLDGSRWVKRAVWQVAGIAARTLPVPLARLAAQVVGDVAWWLDARGRRVVRRNLLPLVPSAAARERVARAMYRNCAAQVAGTLRLARAGLPAAETVRFAGPWHRVPRTGPAVLATLHADWDTLLQALTATGRLHGVAVVALPAGDPVVDHLLAAQRAAAGARTIPWQQAAVGCLRELRAGRMVGLLADRAYSPESCLVRVGRHALSLPTGPLELARRAACPFIPMACVRHSRGVMLVCADPLHPNRDGVRSCLRSWARFQLRVLAANPSRWVAFHPVWAEVSPAP